MCALSCDGDTHTVVLPAEKTSLFERLELDVLDRTYGFIARADMCSAAWKAFADFCEDVMRKKERAKRKRL